ncbi:MAG: 16S rRNA (guanine(527)-N(7))-methyltransferase RsmG [Chitinophagaceae bacterium]|nr:16S rRNA (guanine(527)-N(7))-methyltransferase RsmG [Chitinophagaceae bacterium]
MEILLKYFSGFTPQQINQFKQSETLYKDWNSKINVISRKDIDALLEKHVLHSLAIAAVFDFPPGSEIIDIGTGGGFPGIPLAIYFPEVQFHLVDSVGKKIKVVNEVASALDLKNVSTHHGRAEEIKDRKFDFALSRAVAPLNDLWKWSKPLLRKRKILADEGSKPSTSKPGLICLKGGDLSTEIAESGLRPYTWDIGSMFNEPFFYEKYILYIPI